MSINISTNGRAALASVVNESAAEKLLRSKKVITSLEQSPPNETSARVTKDLRFVLRTVLKSKEAAPEEVEQAGALLLRVKVLGIRREQFRTVKNGNEGVEEPIVAGTSASQVPRPATITFSFLMSVLEAELGDMWRFPDNEFSNESRLGLLEAVLDSKPTIGSVQSLQAELYKKDSRGFTLAGTFPLVARFAKEYLLLHGVAGATKYEDEEKEKARQWIADLDAEMSK